MLRDVEVTAAQKAGVVEILLAQAAQRDELRRDEDLVPDDARARMAELAAERDRALENLLGVDTVSAMKARTRTSRDDGPRGRLFRGRGSGEAGDGGPGAGGRGGRGGGGLRGGGTRGPGPSGEGE
jgi:hypothetical protein